jgi:hypothetical protein
VFRVKEKIEFAPRKKGTTYSHGKEGYSDYDFSKEWEIAQTQ